MHHSIQHVLGSFEDLLNKETFNNNSWTILIIAVLISLRIISYFQREQIHVYYKKSSTMMKDFVKKSKLNELYYTPYMLTINGHLQATLYLLCEIMFKIYFPLKYEREILKLSDGGTIALDWVIDHEGGKPMKGSSRPILCCMSGLSGGNDNMYLYSLMKAATQNGYKCMVINFRGTSGMKLTSGKFYWMSSWEDIKEPIDYIHEKYCSGNNLHYQKRNLYAYAVSLGAGMLTLYLINEGEKCPLTGALSYGLPFALEDNVPFFRKNAFKFYDKLMGFNLSMILKTKIEEMKPHLSEEEYCDFQQKLKDNKFSLMDLDQKLMIPFMGFKTLKEYYAQTQATGQLHKIKTPTFFLNAMDDPCLDNQLYPFKELENNDQIVAVITNRGGHCCHFTGGFRPYQWFPALYMEFLEYLENKSRANLKPK